MHNQREHSMMSFEHVAMWYTRILSYIDLIISIFIDEESKL